MTEQIEQAIEAPAKNRVPKVKKRRKRVRRAAPKEPKQVKVPLEFAGMTTANCCAACSPAGCYISGSVCAHPMKGGLQPTLMLNPEVLERFLRAKKALAHQRLDLRGK